MPSASLIKEFEQLVGKENVFSSEADRQSYAYDAAVLKPMIPSLVVRPTEVEQLGQVVKRCYEEGIPMTVRGSGTNLTGGTIPDCSDTIVILTTGLNKILEINTEDLYATVQPGVITAKFAAAVAAKGLFYPPDPGSMSVHHRRQCRGKLRRPARPQVRHDQRLRHGHGSLRQHR